MSINSGNGYTSNNKNKMRNQKKCEDGCNTSMPSSKAYQPRGRIRRNRHNRCNRHSSVKPKTRKKPTQRIKAEKMRVDLRWAAATRSRGWWCRTLKWAQVGHSRRAPPTAAWLRQNKAWPDSSIDVHCDLIF
jgi:hypothetical protein